MSSQCLHSQVRAQGVWLWDSADVPLRSVRSYGVATHPLRRGRGREFPFTPSSYQEGGTSSGNPEDFFCISLSRAEL